MEEEEKAQSLVVEPIPGTGNGDKIPVGATVKVHYQAAILGGDVFDSTRVRGDKEQSRSDGQPFEFVLGQGKVIKGWEQGF